MYMYGYKYIYACLYIHTHIYIYRHTLVITIVRKTHIVENADKLCELIVLHLSRSLLLQ